MARAAAVLRRGSGPVTEKAVQDPSRLGSGWEGSAVLVLCAGLASIGLVMVYSASAVMAQTGGLAPHYFLLRQMSGALIGLVVMVIAARIDYRRLRPLSWLLIAAAVAMLLAVVLPSTTALAPESNGARRWLVVGSVGIQPSEVAKLALIVWTAALVEKKQDRLRSLSKGLLPLLIVWGLVIGLVLLQPDLSTASLILMLVALVAWAGGARPAHFIALMLVALPFFWSEVQRLAYRMDRIRAFLNPEADITDLGYQVNQSLIALGSGGLVGRGFAEGQQKFGFLPEPHNDFIIAIIGEEWGFIGMAVVTLMFLAFALIGYRIARSAADLFGFLLAVGMTNLLVVQAFLHIAVNVAVVPPTGMTLPFVSYGRSSLIVSFAAAGILISVARVSDQRGQALAKARGRPR